MKNVAAIVGLLLGGFAVALLCGAQPPQAGGIGIALVFAFTALGHFVKSEEMMAMLPARWPAGPLDHLDLSVRGASALKEFNQSWP